jgi:hypothetical protein
LNPTSSIQYSGSFNNTGSFNNQGSFNNTGSINNSGSINNQGNINNTGSVNVSGSLNVNGNSVITGNQTGSYATTGSNNFVGNQTITGSVDITGSLTVSGSGTFTNIGPFSQTGNSIFTGNITASANVSSSATSTSSFGTYLGDGSQLTGIRSGGGTSTMIASGSTSASADPGTGIVVNHSGSTAFSVIGDVGTLFSVDDSLTGTLFSANDISGFPVLQADSTGEVYLGKTPQSLYTTAVVSSTTAATTHSLVSLSTSSYDGAFFEYTAISSSNARAGSIMSVWNGANIVSTETTSSQIGLGFEK